MKSKAHISSGATPVPPALLVMSSIELRLKLKARPVVDAHSLTQNDIGI
jgi:hypothetical protein